MRSGLRLSSLSIISWRVSGITIIIIPDFGNIVKVSGGFFACIVKAARRQRFVYIPKKFIFPSLT